MAQFYAEQVLPRAIGYAASRPRRQPLDDGARAPKASDPRDGEPGPRTFGCRRRRLPAPTHGRRSSGCETRAPRSLLPWLAEPGLLTARVRAACGEAMSLRMLRLERAPLALPLRDRLGVDGRGLPVARDRVRLWRERAGSSRSPCFPDSTVGRYPWLARTRRHRRSASRCARVEDVRREPLEYAELAPDARTRACRARRRRVEPCGVGAPRGLPARRLRRSSCRKSSCPALGHCG